MGELAGELLDSKVDIIVTNGTGFSGAYKRTKTVPIVVGVGGDPDMLGFADNLAYPGGNVTGQVFFLPELMIKRIETLKSIKPTIKTATTIVHLHRSWRSVLQDLSGPVKALGVDLEMLELESPSDCDRALSSGSGASAEVLIVIDHQQFIADDGAAEIAKTAARHGVPAAGPLSFARNGGIFGHGVDFVRLWRRSAAFVDKILKGANPGEIPIERATKFTTIVNLKTAAALGFEIPPTLLAAADEVIE